MSGVLGVITNTAKELEELNKIQDPTSSFGNLRNLIKEAGSQVLPHM